jgi:dihydrodipicolinate synthase/N-acetylneuraminate lyase
MARYPQAVLVSCPLPWDEREELVEDLFRDEVRRVLAAGFRHVYVFGTGGEGYAVDTRRFRQVVAVVREETAADDVWPMVGVIGLSSAVVIERLAIAHEAGFRTFQISLPAWGALADDELSRFFGDVCGRFPDSRFLHYNLPRARRVLHGADYARLLAAVPNLVATKTTGGGLEGAEDLMLRAPELQHFMGEANFPHGSAYGECSLLASYAELSASMTWRLFEAGRDHDEAALYELQHAFQAMSTGLWSQVSEGPHMDGAYDKLLVKLGLLPEFPLRLLSPYVGFGEHDYEAARRYLLEHHPDWLGAGAA